MSVFVNAHLVNLYYFCNACTGRLVGGSVELHNVIYYMYNNLVFSTLGLFQVFVLMFG